MTVPARSDVDVMVVTGAAAPQAKPGKFLHGGVLLEVTYLPRERIASAEQVLASYHLAGGFRFDTIIADPTGELRSLQAVVSRHFAEEVWWRRSTTRRCGCATWRPARCSPSTVSPAGTRSCSSCSAARTWTASASPRRLFNNPASFLLAIVLAGALIAFADASTVRSRVTIGLAHWLAHLLLVVTVLWGAAQVLVDWDLSLMVNVGFLNFRLTAFTVLFVVAVVVVGGYLGSQLFALYLFVMHTTRRKHPTQAFSCQRLEDYRSFLRIKVERDGALTIYPVGVRRVPRSWRLVRDRAPHEPVFEPTDRPWRPI